MSAIVQINFDYNESQTELEAHSEQAASRFTNIDGLQWKVWLVDDASKTTGGIYQFENREKAEAYAAGDLIKYLKSVRHNVVVKIFDTIEAPGLVTNAPC